MRFLYTLRHGSVPGNCGGDLRLFLTTLNSADWEPSPPAPNPPGRWLYPRHAPETLTLPSGDTIEFNLNPIGDVPGLVYIFGIIRVVTKSGKAPNPSPMGNATLAALLPNKPVYGVLHGEDKQNTNGISWDVGFRLTVPWDGVSADCTGHWWARWHPLA